MRSNSVARRNPKPAGGQRTTGGAGEGLSKQDTEHGEVYSEKKEVTTVSGERNRLGARQVHLPFGRHREKQRLELTRAGKLKRPQWILATGTLH